VYLRYEQKTLSELKKESIYYTLQAQLVDLVAPADRQVSTRKLLKQLDADHHSLLRDQGFPWWFAEKNQEDTQTEVQSAATDQEKYKFLEVVSAQSAGAKTFSEVLSRINDLVSTIRTKKEQLP
jgi:hypothetical protein